MQHTNIARVQARNIARVRPVVYHTRVTRQKLKNTRVFSARECQLINELYGTCMHGAYWDPGTLSYLDCELPQDRIPDPPDFFLKLLSPFALRRNVVTYILSVRISRCKLINKLEDNCIMNEVAYWWILAMYH